MRRWTQDDLFQIAMLAASDQLHFTEIGKIMKRSPQMVSYQARKMGFSRPAKHRIGGWNRIHAHMREEVMRYFVSHTMEQTRKHFKLTPSQIKSLFTCGYKDPRLKHLRKDTRTKESWTADQLKTLLQSSGIRPRSWIAKKLKRGNVHSCIKERLERLGVASRTLNGVTLTSYVAMFNKRPRIYLKTDAGPGRGKFSATYFKIIPWYQIEKDFQDGYIKTKNQTFRKASKTMCLFQNWIFDGNARKQLLNFEVKDA